MSLMMLEIKNLVVKDVLEIKNLKQTYIMISIEGQSGSGKSTLLRLLNNLDDPTSGSIQFGDELITSIPPQTLRQKIVMVPQDPVMFDGTIRDNLLIGLKFSGSENVADDKLEETLELLWVDKDVDTKASELSGVEKQRVALGRVLLMEKAEVYLHDEASSDLYDQTCANVMKKFIETAKKHNKQMIMVTHDKRVSEKFADTVINMDQYSKQIKKEEEEL